MLSLILLLVLSWSFYIGYSRGLIVQAFHSLSAVLALVIAASQHKGLAKLYAQWVPFANATEGAKNYFFASKYLYDLDQVFYAGLAFLSIYFLAYVLLRIIGILVHLTDGLLPEKAHFRIIAGSLSFLVTLVSLQIVLTIAATVPLANIQQPLRQSWVANFIINGLPLLSENLKNLLVSTIQG